MENPTIEEMDESIPTTKIPSTETPQIETEENKVEQEGEEEDGGEESGDEQGSESDSYGFSEAEEGEGVQVGDAIVSAEDAKDIVRSARGKEKGADVLMEQKDYSTASFLYEDALKELCAVYGELSPRVAELYIKYGNSLISATKQEEIDNFKNALSKTLMENPDFANGNIPSTQNSTTTTTNTTTTTTTTTTTNTAASDKNTPDRNAEKLIEEAEDLDEEDGDNKKPDLSSKEKTENGEGEGEGEGEEDVSAVQIAYESFETARIIYEKMANKPLELCKVHLVLGDFFIDTDQFETSISEYETAFKIMEESRLNDYKTFADIHHSLACAYHIYHNMSLAEKYYGSAIDFLNKEFKQVQDQIVREDNKEKVEELEKRLQDIKLFIADINTKLIEVTPIDTSKEPVPKELQQDEQQPVFATKAAATPSNPTTPVKTFGVLGKAARRSTPPPSQNPSATSTTSEPRPKRRLEDLMGGIQPSFPSSSTNTTEENNEKKQKL
ncbi:hypothetical protein DICPUDRAFT_151812 [Dictyostelium purpureum]|uniref:Tetratricopeptide SHNi-TPR domain-containing protein n=1 Tax=Dictyostelium purpureum TaxID=5786 RepID=F0ZJT4_DICPU|nr:uncharacterized protein DICPUDRAFT_151812 [Dictyostelium purpureum]EGC35796.1 hypothetical protein DICPUDRAFT_151812 [Dictyostelium purpureum]|eukprot:XP_003287690.1 hypothetical protein DICPUDRAFT_151812 [Dictyostelium purpureum]